MTSEPRDTDPDFTLPSTPKPFFSVSGKSLRPPRLATILPENPNQPMITFVILVMVSCTFLLEVMQCLTCR
jgi:hypothetical protein